MSMNLSLPTKINKWFWRFLQHVSAPSEKEIREGLIRYMVIICCTVNMVAPTYCLPLTPDQVAVRAEEELEAKYCREAQDLEVRFNDLALSNTKKGVTTHRFYLNTEYNEEAITLFKNNLEKTNWDVYDDNSPGANRMLTIVRRNVIPI